MTEPSLNYTLEVEKTPMPSHIPDVDEVGATSAPLLSASFFIGARCTPYNDDFMLCKQENPGHGELNCLKEGRRVTRCATSVLQDLNKYCSDSFKLHWQCLEQNNHKLNGCRKAEKLLSKCVFDNMNLIKKIPGVKEQIHLKENPNYVPNIEDHASKVAFEKAKTEGKL